MRKINLDAENTAIILWKFVHNIQLIDFSKSNLQDDEATAISEIITAAEEIHNNKYEIYELLKK